ncbi:MFS transporter [Tuberibacillus calidus]|uniref:MFS transporter n=1 Tax=Tuberibacillus calidus TaxID=340097 RepID=UPI0004017CDB|nr:MFS transporter [Tuberibacillus calidus]
MTALQFPLYRFIVLVGAVFVSGASQGMLLPLLSILLEEAGTSAALNGFNASALYIGVMLASPFIEKPMQKYGYRPVLLIGLLSVGSALFLFPVWKAFWFWFFLRVLIGIGDNMLHFSAQVWIMAESPNRKKGLLVAIYGLSFGVGFAVGPLMTRLVQYGIYWPFLVTGLGCMVFVILGCFLKNSFPSLDSQSARTNPLRRYKKALFLCWGGLFASFAYGFLEASLNGNFPVFAVRNGFSVNTISVLLPMFVVGSLLTQIPLGALGDKIGRKKLVPAVTFIGGLSFMCAVFFANSPFALAIVFLISGMFVGSLYSMGMTYISDLLPPSLLAAGNILAGIAYSIGSMCGPSVGGFFINSFRGGIFFVAIAGVLFLTCMFCLLQKPFVAVDEHERVNL